MGSYRIIIQGPQLWIEQEVERAVAEEIGVELLSNILPVPKASSDVSEDGGREAEKATTVVGEEFVPGEKDWGLREMKEELDLSRGVDLVLLTGYYLKRRAGQERFDTDAVREGYEQMAEPKPKNLSRDISWGVRLHWIERVEGERGVYYVTAKGERVVESGFSKELTEGSSYRKAG